MKMCPTRLKIIGLQDKIKQLQEDIKSIQSKCKHPKKFVTKKYCSNTGNYDPSQDVYWIEYHCDRCNNKWTVITHEGTL